MVISGGLGRARRVRGISLVGALCACWMSPWSAHAGTASPPEDAAVSVRTLPAGRFVYVMYTGPYWAVGPRLAQVRADMARADAPECKLLVRYLDNPQTTYPSRMRIQVGFLAPDSFQAGSAYSAVDWPETRAAGVDLGAARSSPRRSMAELSAWALDQGLEICGPLMEIYENPSVGSGELETTVLLPVQVLPNVIATELPSLPSEVTTAEEQQAAVEPASAGGVTDNERTIVHTANPVGFHDTSRPSESSAVVGAALPGAHHRIEESGSPPHEDDLAPKERVIVDGLLGGQDASHKTWDAMITLRVRAVARALARRGSSSAPRVGALSAALDRRFTEVWGADAGDVSRHPLSSSNDANSSARQNALREVDHLLGQMAVRTISDDAAADRLVELLGQMAARFGSAGEANAAMIPDN